ncbi:cytochrome c oxidase subunit 6B [Biomphalaria pfeifferi]|uniref:Cytochrome c oxidase subunit 6B n=1 Tax=Biomphalaria pfeifferi TaxID=112525 RepID=A0AAD8F638_BIOPF|nr:cytochrome c oxidase subunit 6B [Biomphalaria pfeifferi]
MGDKPCPPTLPKPCPSKTTSKSSSSEETKAFIKDEKKASPSKSKGNCKTFWSPGVDSRFPNQNQTRRCWQNYVDYIRCTTKFGDDYEACEYFKKTYTFLCPEFWIEHWDEQREKDAFPMPRWG